MKRLAIPAVFALGLLASSLGASVHPNHARGGNGVVQAAGLDNVGLYNGALSMSIPLGPTYRVGPGLSYRLSLAYNSSIWDYATIIDSQGIWIKPDPSKAFNAGAGWTVGLGRLLAPVHSPTGGYFYVSPDGGGHRFFKTLHRGESDDDPVVYFTRDGSYLKMSKLYGGNDWRSIEFPNGVEQVFYKSNQGPINGTWYLDHMKDRHGNRFDLAYAFDGDDETWTLTDSLGRVQILSYSQEPGLSWPTLQQLDLQTVANNRLIYTFDYTADQHFARSCKGDYQGNPAVQYPRLASVTMPDGSSFEMQDANGVPWYNDSCNGVDDKPGTLQRIKLPTGGMIEWDYQEVVFPPGTTQSVFNSAAGVGERRLVRADGTVEATWTYKTSTGGGTEAEIYTELVYPPTETGGAQHCTKHYFSAWYFLDPNWGDDLVHRGWDLGLPFVWSVEAEPGSERYLSSETYATSNANGSCSGAPLRSSYLTYEHDKLPNSTTKPEEWFESNRRVGGSRTVFHDDGDRYIDTAYSNFDGVGHYRTATVTTDIVGAGVGTLTRSNHTEFNPAFGVYCYDRDSNAACPSHTYQQLAEDQNWVLGAFDFNESSEPGAYGETESRQEFEFDSDGVLLKTRALASGLTRAANDLLSEFIYDPVTGDLTSVRAYGGDVQALDVGPGWNLPLGGYQYRSDMTYVKGVLTTGQSFDTSGAALPFLDYDATIDPNSGAVLTARTPAGYQTTMVYDALGRLAEVVPQSGAKTVYTFSDPAVFPWIQGTQQANGTTVLTEQKVEYDDFGRVVASRSLTADHGEIEAITTYNPRGWLATQSVPGYTSHLTEYLEYDPFGRAHRIRPSDGAKHDVEVVYDGIRHVETKTSRATDPGTETYVSSDSYSDGFGRLRSVVQPAGVAGAPLTTSYQYDVAGSMTRIASSEGSLQGITQLREYAFDNRGFLLKEKHPEKGVLGNDWVYYYDYDAAGNAGRVLDGTSHLRNVYDAFARLLRVEDINNGDRPVVEYAYDLAGGFGTGQVWKAIRHNYRQLPWLTGETDVAVTETFTYSGLQGQVSQRTTEIAPQNYAFTTNWAYTSLGRIGRIDYPTCTSSGCAGVATSQAVTYQYTNGQLTSIPGWASSITYHKHGLVDQIAHANGVTDDINRDGSGIPRPKRIQTVGVTSGQDWDSFVYDYDGSGSIKSIGNDSFLYDGVGRLAQATIDAHTRSFVYDSFGNIDSVTTLFPDLTVETYATPTDSATNRLTAATYDANGSVSYLAGYAYAYDALQRLMSSTASGSPEDKTYVYTASGQRLWEIKDTTASSAAASSSERFSLRDLGGKTLRTFTLDRSVTETWAHELDYIYRGSKLLASEKPGDELLHFHLDHLGSPRLLTDSAGGEVSRHTYFPYGAELTDATQSTERMRFTGHERDTPTSGGTGSLDYMRARYYNAHYGRFLRVDPLRGSPGNPQTLNRYAYAAGSPTNYTDPTGAFISWWTLGFTDIITVIASPSLVSPGPGISGIPGSQGGGGGTGGGGSGSGGPPDPTDPPTDPDDPPPTTILPPNPGLGGENPNPDDDVEVGCVGPECEGDGDSDDGDCVGGADVAGVQGNWGPISFGVSQDRYGRTYRTLGIGFGLPRAGSAYTSRILGSNSRDALYSSIVGASVVANAVPGFAGLGISIPFGPGAIGFFPMPGSVGTPLVETHHTGVDFGIGVGVTLATGGEGCP